VRAETRHQLKEDRFSRATIDAAEKTVHWSAEHQDKLTIAVVVVLVVLVIGLGARYYLNLQDQKASVAFSKAVRTMDMPVRPPDMPAQPDNPSFATSQERATAAHKEFQELANNYPHTRAADFAQYFLGVTSVTLGDNAAAERELQKVASFYNADLSSLAKFALASVYRNTSRNKQAIDIYKQLMAKPTSTVSKATAQLELGATYQADNQPLEAKRIYEQVKKDNPTNEAGQMATAKLEALK
jgi:predicted negative regulator of RcsB-dependent stress response